MSRRCLRPAQAFAVLPRLRQAGPSSLAQNLPFELREDGQQASHRATGWCGEIQGLGQRDKADSQMFQFLKDGTMKSAHSAIPLPDDPTKVFQAIASESTYSFGKAGLVTMKAKGPEAGEETWHCVTITEDRKIEARQVFMKRGDLVMTLIGMNGEPAFTRQLRKGGA